MQALKNNQRQQTPKFPYDTLDVRYWSTTTPARSVTLTDPLIELNWLPTIGPTATVLLRRLGSELASNPTLKLVCADWATALGVGHKGGYHSPFWRAIRRLERFGIVHMIDDTLLVKGSLPLTPGP